MSVGVPKMTVIIVEDHRLVRDLLRRLCIQDFGAKVVDETGSA
jgi:DNA-binding NarL/FixJ family response regulator